MTRSRSRRSMVAALRVAAAVCLILSSCKREPQAPALAYLAQSNGYWQVWGSDADGGNPRLLLPIAADVTRISWYPDARAMLVNLQDGRWFKLDTASGNAEALTPPMTGIQDAVIGPDGHTVAFSFGASESRYNNDLWRIDLNSEEVIKLTSVPGLQHDPSWSSDGAWIYFLSGMGGQSHDIWRMSADGRRREQVTVNELYHFDLDLRDDGVIAYSGNRNGNYDIWIRPADGEPKALTDDLALDARPSWSADGQSLYFESYRDEAMEIWRVNVDDGALFKVTSSPDGARMPAARPEGA
jgi:TolB protein